MDLIKRYEGNPILKATDNDWEQDAAFNPAAYYDEARDVVILLYRGLTRNHEEGRDYSATGYAEFKHGKELIYRMEEPLIKREYDYETIGAEDARVTKLGDVFLITYVGFNWQLARTCLATSTDLKTIKKHGILTRHDIWDKDVVIFPELINGKLYMLRRVEPNIQYCYFEDLDELIKVAEDPEYNKKYWERFPEDSYIVRKPEFDWEARKIGAGPPPIKTEEGWLVITHGVDENWVYRMSAMLLDDDMRVIRRTPKPLMEPEMDYELYGIVDNVVFPEGLAVIDGVLHIYYGGADKYTCLATCKLEDLLDHLINECR